LTIVKCLRCVVTNGRGLAVMVISVRVFITGQHLVKLSFCKIFIKIRKWTFIAQKLHYGALGELWWVMVGVTDSHEQQHFDEFFEEIFDEVEDKYGEIEEMNVCDNIGEHMIGNVYIKFKREEDAERAVKDLNTRWFGGMPIYAELSPVTDFREACCRQYEMGDCGKGGFCNFMHLKPISRELRRRLYGRRKRAGFSSFDRFPERRRSRSRGRERDRRSRY
ncbi:Splicing factor U2AF 35 kDa subunit, partial [Trichinella britovi]